MILQEGGDGSWCAVPATAIQRPWVIVGPRSAQIVGITYRQLDYWARTEPAATLDQRSQGSGSQRRYSYTDLVQLKVIKRLLDAGVSLHVARKAIECLRSPATTSPRPTW